MLPLGSWVKNWRQTQGISRMSEGANPSVTKNSMNFIGIVDGKGKVLFFKRITTVDTK